MIQILPLNVFFCKKFLPLLRSGSQWKSAFTPFPRRDYGWDIEPKLCDEDFKSWGPTSTRYFKDRWWRPNHSYNSDQAFCFHFAKIIIKLGYYKNTSKTNDFYANTYVSDIRYFHYSIKSHTRVNLLNRFRKNESIFSF